MLVRAGAGPAPGGVRIDVHASKVLVEATLAHSEVVHPGLARVGAAFARARGGDSLHGGAVAGRHGAWALIGAKTAGKSTLLAALARQGTPVVCDDTLVLHGDRVMAGPRCIDLRPESDRFGPAQSVRPASPRRRISLPAIAAEHTMAGLIYLEWSDAPCELVPLGRRAAMECLIALHEDVGWPSDPHTLLDLIGLRTYVLRRRPDWETLDASVSAVAQLVGGHRSDAVLTRA